MTYMRHKSDKTSSGYGRVTRRLPPCRAMTSLWTDDDDSAHPWVAARPSAAPPPPHDAGDEPAARQSLRGVAIATAGTVAALAGAVFAVLR